MEPLKIRVRWFAKGIQEKRAVTEENSKRKEKTKMNGEEQKISPKKVLDPNRRRKLLLAER